MTAVQILFINPETLNRKSFIMLVIEKKLFKKKPTRRALCLAAVCIHLFSVGFSFGALNKQKKRRRAGAVKEISVNVLSVS
jgi:hypothetical protein